MYDQITIQQKKIKQKIFTKINQIPMSIIIQIINKNLYFIYGMVHLAKISTIIVLAIKK